VSTIKVDTVQSSGGGVSALTQQNASKYFIKYDAINNGNDGSLNSSSVSDDGTGVQTYNYTNNFTGADYASVAGMVSRSFRTKNTNGTAMIDMDPVALINVGDLA
jgi:hypothetical protein